MARSLSWLAGFARALVIQNCRPSLAILRIACFKLQHFQSLHLQLQARYKHCKAGFSGLNGFAEALRVKPSLPCCAQTRNIFKAKTQSLRLLDTSQSLDMLQAVNAVPSPAQGRINDPQALVKADGLNNGGRKGGG